MMEWWNALAGDLQVFYGIGLLASLLLIIQLIMTVLGADGGADFDAADGVDSFDGVDGDHGDGLGLISTRTIVAFLTGFGWTGAIARGLELNLMVSVLIALVVGFILMLLVFWLMKGLYSLRQSGSLDYHNAIGEVGTVYVGIPPKGEGSGQIQVTVQGRLATVAALSEAPEKIPSGSQVKVVKLLAGNMLQVETL